MRRLPAYPLAIGMSAVQGLAWATVVTTNLVYHVETVGLNALQLVLVGTVLEATVFIFEVPTGVVADVYSRRLSVLVGLALMGAGFVLAGAIPLFVVVLAGQVVWGFGYTFTSGARTAWLADEIGEHRLSGALLRGAQADLIGGLAGIALAVALSSVARALPIVVGGSIFVALAAFLAFTMTEHGFRPVPSHERETLRTMASTLIQALRVIRGRRVLVLVVAVPFLFGVTSEVPDRLSTPFLLETITLPPLGPLDPVAWFGLSGYVSRGLSLGVIEVVRRRVNMSNDGAVAGSLAVIQVLYIGTLIAFGLAVSLPMALAMFWMRAPLLNAGQVLLSVWQNRFIPARVRATVLSLGGQGDAIGQVIGGPILGALALGLSLRAAFVAAGLVLVPVVLVFAMLGRGRAASPAPS